MMQAEDEVDLVVERGPESAGPLNSHGLILRSLVLMRSLSPDYTRRFLSHAETLLWLEQASGKLKPSEATRKTERRSPKTKKR